jgi:signal transduction histidine kinase
LANEYLRLYFSIEKACKWPQRSEMGREATAEQSVFLSTLPASARERRAALLVVLVSFGIFLLAAPFAQVKLPEVWAFIPSYQSALLVTDLITSVLLFAQFALLRSQALLVLAGGYLFTAFMAVPHALSFPRLFAPEGLIGAGPQTTAWLYMIWHAGFPLAVIGYALLRDSPRARRPAIAAALTCVIALASVCAAALLTTAGHALLPAIMRGDGYTLTLPIVTGTVWTLSLMSLLVLWKQRAYSVLDVWLMVVLSAWLLDIALSAMLNAGRFDLGFYAGRVYGLMAATLVLLVLLIQTGAVYARLARSFEVERDVRDRELHEIRAELIHVSRLTELGQMVSALAHEVNQPLTAAGSYVRAGRRLVQAGEVAKADEALQRGVEQVTRASQVIQRLRQFVKKADSECRPEDVRQVIEEAAALALLGAEGRGVHLEMDFAPDTPLVFIDKVQVQQVLLNLIRNAVEAMQSSPRRELAIRTIVRTDGMVEVSVADSGPGLAADVREKLFQPFVTTKATGMGVGLSICRGIVEAQGGQMWLADDTGGAKFHFTLPATGADAAETMSLAAVTRA